MSEYKLDIRRVNHRTAAEARGVAIVIDVIRAFTVATYAFAGGARRLWLVRSVEDALALRKREPEALLIGEVSGRLIPGFDLNNSPALMAKSDVLGKLLIQRTGAGTQGAVGVSNATHILLCSLANAQATATYAEKLAQEADGIVTLFPTGSAHDFAFGSEDDLCADYVEALLRKRTDASDVLARGIAHLRTSDRFDLWEQGEPDFPREDIEKVLDANRFEVVMVGRHEMWEDVTYVDVERMESA